MGFYVSHTDANIILSLKILLLLAADIYIAITWGNILYAYGFQYFFIYIFIKSNDFIKDRTCDIFISTQHINVAFAF